VEVEAIMALAHDGPQSEIESLRVSFADGIGQRFNYAAAVERVTRSNILLK
jgi:hypothetical protein